MVQVLLTLDLLDHSLGIVSHMSPSFALGNSWLSAVAMTVHIGMFVHNACIETEASILIATKLIRRPLFIAQSSHTYVTGQE